MSNRPEIAISLYVLENYQKLDVYGQEKPETIHHVLATIQDMNYMGAGEYTVALDIRGTVACSSDGIKENEHYTTTCTVVVTANAESVPVPEINGKLILTKLKF